MVVLRSGTIGDGASVHLVPMRGVPMARTRTIGADGTAAVEECTSTDCAQAIAVRASALAAQTNFRATAIERPGSTTQRILVRMCPIDGDDSAAIATNAAWAWAGAYAPCKWRVVPDGALADWPANGRAERSGAGRRHRVPDGPGRAPAGARWLTVHAAEPPGCAGRCVREEPIAGDARRPRTSGRCRPHDALVRGAAGAARNIRDRSWD